MESFYGGKRGFSFILRSNPDVNSNGYWPNRSSIVEAVNNKQLQQGEYAIITEDGPSQSDEHGKIYRIMKSGNLELIGKIGNPAPLYDLSLINDGYENAQEITFHFLDDSGSWNAHGVKSYWKMIESNGERYIGIGFDFPRPVFQVENISVNQGQFVQEVTDNRPAGMTITNEYDSDISQSYPMRYNISNVIPASSFIGTMEQRIDANLNNFNLGDLWWESRNKNDLSSISSMEIIDIKKDYINNDLMDMDFSFATPISNTYRLGYMTLNEESFYDALVINDLSPSSEIQLFNNFTQNMSLETLLISLSFVNTENYNDYNCFKCYEIVFEKPPATEESEITEIALEGELGKITSFSFLKTNSEDWEDVDLSTLTLKKIAFFDFYTGTEREGLENHLKLINSPSPFKDFYNNEATVNIKDIIATITFGMTISIGGE